MSCQKTLPLQRSTDSPSVLSSSRNEQTPTNWLSVTNRTRFSRSRSEMLSKLERTEARNSHAKNSWQCFFISAVGWLVNIFVRLTLNNPSDKHSRISLRSSSEAHWTREEEPITEMPRQIFPLLLYSINNSHRCTEEECIRLIYSSKGFKKKLVWREKMKIFRWFWKFQK